ncbi:MAG: carbohydrate kinase family protein [Clostridia bacterium]|nr:carbohydrate kinase family protein [Clostridia bacterium]
MKKILCVGIVTVDVITRPVSALPPAGGMTHVESVSMHVGGCAANAAADLSRMGFSPALVIKTGDDGFASFVRNYLSSVGVDLSGVVTDPALETGATAVLVSPSGERSFLHNPGANDRLLSSDVPDSLLDECDFLFVAGTFLMEDFDGEECRKLLIRAREKGLFTCLDTAWDFRGYWMKKLGLCLPYLDLFMPSYDEAVRLADGETSLPALADFFFSHGAKNVVIKCGSDGAYIAEAGKEPFLSPSFPVEKPADTTGAGDSFCAGFLAALSMGRNFEEASRLGNVIGHFCVTGVGASSGIPSLEEAEEYMKKHAKPLIFGNK